MKKKYKLTSPCINVYGHTLHRIEAIRDFGDVRCGDKGGYVESEDNLSHDGECWVSGEAKVLYRAQVFGSVRVSGSACVYGSASVGGDACVGGEAKVYDHAQVFVEARVRDNARVYGNAMVCGDAMVCGAAQIAGNAKVTNMTDYIVFKNWWSSGRYFTWTRSNNMWSVGCFHGTGDELIKRAYNDSELSGREYERVVKYVNEILNNGN